MGLTPLEGLVMGTRCGDVDPALVFHLQRLGMKQEDIHDAMQYRSGLLGISGVSADMRDVYAAAEQGHERARLALDIFAYRVRKYLGSFLAMLGKCDAVIFTGGIGEKAAFMRARILEDLEPLGIQLDAQRNELASEGGIDPDASFRISTEKSSIEVWVIPTNEELMIARDTWRLIRGDDKTV
jgi:acetate kinase